MFQSIFAGSIVQRERESLEKITKTQIRNRGVKLISERKIGWSLERKTVTRNPEGELKTEVAVLLRERGQEM